MTAGANGRRAVAVSPRRARSPRTCRAASSSSPLPASAARTGLCYLSKHDDLTNWPVFEPATPDVLDVAEFDHDDPDLLADLAVHNSDSSNAPEKDRPKREPARIRCHITRT